MRVELYVETTRGSGEYERLDMFDDEDIILNLKLKDTGDIAKAYSTYTQTFTVPTKDRNARLLNFFFNPDIRAGGEKGRSINAKIYLNKELFKVGFIILSGQKEKMLETSSISLTFYTGAATLKDKVGDDKIANIFTDPSYKISWTDSTVRTLLTNQYTQIVPLISTNRVLTYGDYGADDIKYSGSTLVGKKFLHKDELRPAITLKHLVNEIISHYDLDVVIPFDNEDMYRKLYVWGNSNVIPTGLQDFPLEQNFGGYSTDGTLPLNWNISSSTVTDTFSIMRTTGSADSQFAVFNMVWVPTRVFGGDSEIEIIVEGIDTRPATAGQKIFSNKGSWTDGGFNTQFSLASPSRYGITTSNPLTFKLKVSSSQPIAWTNCEFALYVYNSSTATLPSYQKLNQFNTSAPLNPYLIDIIKCIPDMKVIDLLDSLFKMFNISVREDNKSTKSYWEKNDSSIEFTPKDFTSFSDVGEVSIDTQDVYKSYIFSHNTPKYRSSVDYVNSNTDNPNSKEFGQLITTVDEVYAKNEYSLKTKFNIIPPRMIPETQMQTFYGFTSEPGEIKTQTVKNSVGGNVTGTGTVYKPNNSDFTIFYNIGATYMYFDTPTDFSWTQPIAQVGFYSGGVNTMINTMNYIGIADNINASDYTNSLGFKDEVNIQFIPYTYEKNLFSNFYSDVISDLNNPNKFFYTYKCILPSNEINEFDLRVPIIIGERSYKVQEAQINLTTGLSKFKLINR